MCFRMQQTNLGQHLGVFSQALIWLPQYPPAALVSPGHMNLVGGGENDDVTRTQQLYSQGSDGEGTVELNFDDDGNQI